MNLRPPMNVEAECTLLVSCMQKGITPSCAPDDFYNEKHRLVARAMCDLEVEGITPDLPSVCEKLSGRVMASDIVGLTDMSAGTLDDDGIERFSKIVSDLSAARKIQIRAAQFVTEVGKPNGKTVSDMVAEFSSEVIRNGEHRKTSRDVTMQEGMSSFIQKFEKRVRDGLQVTGLTTSLPKLDRVTCGLCEQELWILAARPSMGKTALALKNAVTVAKNGGHVLIFSLDMARDGLYERMAATESRINLAKIRSGACRDDETARVLRALSTLHSLPITISDVPATEVDIVRKARRYKPALVVVDFLQKVIPSKPAKSKDADIGNICQALKNLGKTQGIPIMLLSQLNRDSAKEKRPPSLHDLRDSGNIEQDADVVIFLHASSKEDHNRDLIIAKQRQGECIMMRLTFNGAYQDFDEADW